MQLARLRHEGFGDGIGLRDVGQFRIEHASKGEQSIALVLQRDRHQADASCIPGLAVRQLLDDKVEQHLPGGQGWARERQNVMAQPLGERSDVAGQLMRLGPSLPGKRQLGGKLIVWTKLVSRIDLGLQRLAPGHGVLGQTRQRVGKAFALALDVKHIAMAWRVAPGGLLSGAQALYQTPRPLTRT